MWPLFFVFSHWFKMTGSIFNLTEFLTDSSLLKDQKTRKTQRKSKVIEEIPMACCLPT
jgi:hypothetical protein